MSPYPVVVHAAATYPTPAIAAAARTDIPAPAAPRTRRIIEEMQEGHAVGRKLGRQTRHRGRDPGGGH